MGYKSSIQLIFEVGMTDFVLLKILDGEQCNLTQTKILITLKLH